MNHEVKKLLGSVVMAAALTVTFGLPSAAATDEPPADQLQPTWKVGSIQEADELPTGLKVGEQKVVHELGSVTTYYGISAACTEAITVNKPYKTGSQVLANVSFQRSAGCTGAKQYTGLLYSQTWITWDQKDRISGNLNPGLKLVMHVSAPCYTSSSASWKSAGFFGSNGGGINESAIATLACQS